MAFLTMYFAALAKINVGVIVTIWSMNPLFMALCDYILFRNKLNWYDQMGMLAIGLCIILLSLHGVNDYTPSVPGQAPINRDIPLFIDDILG